MTTSVKTCFKCNVEQPLSEFYAHPRMADGHLNKCKSCTKRDARDRRFDPRFREKVLTYDRKRGSRQGREYQENYKRNYPLANKARYMLHNAVRDGKIEKPDRCEHCNTYGVRLSGHHEDYKRPLDVIWLCDACHHQLHAFYRTIGREIPGKDEDVA